MDLLRRARDGHLRSNTSGFSAGPGRAGTAWRDRVRQGPAGVSAFHDEGEGDGGGGRALQRRKVLGGPRGPRDALEGRGGKREETAPGPDTRVRRVRAPPEGRGAGGPRGREEGNP